MDLTACLIDLDGCKGHRDRGSASWRSPDNPFQRAASVCERVAAIRDMFCHDSDT
jgi:hypothetical protein